MSRFNAESDYDYLAETGNETPDRQREAEEYRERRQAEFVDVLRRGRLPTWLRHFADVAEGRTDPYYGRLLLDIRAYVDEFGWPATLHAIAYAIDTAPQGQTP